MGKDGEDGAEEKTGRWRETFLSEIDRIREIVGFVARRNRLSRANAEDFTSFVNEKLIENDYRILARFEGRCALGTYLTAVVHRLFLRFRDGLQRDQLRIRWRPSAPALRLGPVAVRLEALLERDGRPLAEAVEVLKSNEGVAEDREELFALAQRLPRRQTPRQLVEPEALEQVPDPRAFTDAALPRAREALAQRAVAALERGLAALAGRDRLVLRLHFADGLTVADVARTLALDQKGLYRRIQKLLEELRRGIEADGVVAGDLEEILAGMDWDMGAATGQPRTTPETPTSARVREIRGSRPTNPQ